MEQIGAKVVAKVAVFKQGDDLHPNNKNTIFVLLYRRLPLDDILIKRVNCNYIKRAREAAGKCY